MELFFTVLVVLVITAMSIFVVSGCVLLTMAIVKIIRNELSNH